MRDRLIRLYESTADALRESGRAWYPTAERVAAELGGDAVEQPKVAAIIAALSPQTRWRSNVEAANAVLWGDLAEARRHCYRANIDKADRIARGADPADVLGGPKVRAFWANLSGDTDAVTVDVWATRAATAGRRSDPGNAYARIANAYKAAAWAVGESPRDFQAIIWLAARPDGEHKRDLAALAAV